MVPRIGSKRFQEVTPADLSLLYSALEKPEARRNKKEGCGLSNLTIWHVHTFLEALYSFAEHNGDLDRSPARKTRPNVPRCADKMPPAVDVAETERLLQTVREVEPTLFPPVMVSTYLGTRRGETCGVRWSDIDFAKSEVTIRRSVTRTKLEGLLIKSTKTKKERTLPLDPATLTEFESLRRSQRRDRMTWGPGWEGGESPDDDYVCTSLNGSVLNPDAFSSRYRTFAHRNGFAAITPHVLRHAFVSQLIALGFDAVTIASMSGHSPDVLLNVYAHAFDERKRDAMEALAEARRLVRVTA